MPATDYLRNQLVDHVLRTATFAKPASIAVALTTTVPTAAVAGTAVAGGAYARQVLAPLNANWYSTNGTLAGASSGATGSSSNGAALTFPAPTADWGIIYGIEVWDALAAGNRLFYGVLSVTPSDAGYCGFAPFAVYSGEGAVIIPAQALALVVT